MGAGVIPFRLDIPEADLADLRQRITRTRWPEPETAPGWAQGVPLAYLQELAGYWADGPARLPALRRARQ